MGRGPERGELSVQRQEVLAGAGVRGRRRGPGHGGMGTRVRRRRDTVSHWRVMRTDLPFLRCWAGPRGPAAAEWALPPRHCGP